MVVKIIVISFMIVYKYNYCYLYVPISYVFSYDVIYSNPNMYDGFMTLQSVAQKHMGG